MGRAAPRGLAILDQVSGGIEWEKGTNFGIGSFGANSMIEHNFAPRICDENWEYGHPSLEQFYG